MSEMKECELCMLEIIQAAISKQDLPKLIEIRDEFWNDSKFYGSLAESCGAIGWDMDTYRYLNKKRNECYANARYIGELIPSREG